MTRPPDRARLLAIDRACIRLVDALDEGDLEAVRAIWQAAETDPELARALAETCQALAEEERDHGPDA